MRYLFCSSTGGPSAFHCAAVSFNALSSSSSIFSRTLYLITSKLHGSPSCHINLCFFDGLFLDDGGNCPIVPINGLDFVLLWLTNSCFQSEPPFNCLHVKSANQ